MQQKIVPTSPKSPYTELINHRQKPRYFREVFVSIVFSLFFGAIAGFFGFVIAANVPSEWPIIGKINAASYLAAQRNNILFSSDGGDPFLLQSSPWALDYVAAIYSGEPTVETPAEFFGNAVIVTSDGWLVTSIDVLNKASDPQAVRIILPNGLVSTIVSRLNDDLTNTVFFKVEAKNLSAVTFDQKQNNLVGQTLSILEKQLGTYIINERRLSGEYFRDQRLRSTTELVSTPVFSDATGLTIGLPVFSSQAAFVGIVTANGKLLQSSLLEGALKSILNNNVIKRFQEEIKYINVARLTEAERKKRQLPLTGFLINAAPELSGLRTNDVILTINNNDIDEADDLSIIIHSQALNSVLTLKVLRDKKEQLISLNI